MANVAPDKTTMKIVEAFIVDAGAAKGDLVINVEAKRGDNVYKLPYSIPAASVAKFDMDNFMAKVRSDVDAKQSNDSQKHAVLDKIRGMMTDSIALD